MSLIQVDASHYFDLSYDKKGRFNSYWHQIDEILRTQTTNVLEIGKGNGFISNYVGQMGVSVTTLDIDSELHPDALGSVLQVPFKDGAFDLVVCYEVLEHLPFQHFTEGLAELRRVSKKKVVISVPDASRAYKVAGRLPGVRNFNWLVKVPNVKPPVLVPGGEHFWEIGVKGYPLNRIQENIEASGFDIKRSYRVFEYVRHRFFVLEHSAQMG